MANEAESGVRGEGAGVQPHPTRLEISGAYQDVRAAVFYDPTPLVTLRVGALGKLGPVNYFTPDEADRLAAELTRLAAAARAGVRG